MTNLCKNLASSDVVIAATESRGLDCLDVGGWGMVKVLVRVFQIGGASRRQGEGEVS